MRTTTQGSACYPRRSGTIFDAAVVRVGGKIVERRVRIGDVVKASKALAMLDPADLHNTLLNARAQLVPPSIAPSMRSSSWSATARKPTNLIAPAQLETTQDAYASAVAQRDSALAQMALADDHLRYATLIADHDGVITSEDANTGQNVESGKAVFHLDWSGDLGIVCDVSGVSCAISPSAASLTSA